MIAKARHRLIVVTFFGLALSIPASACHPAVDVTSTTAAAVPTDAAILEVARARCRRAGECNHYGGGHRFASELQCIAGVQDPNSGVTVLRCAKGVDRGRLDRCLSSLASEMCEVELGPITGIDDCDSYCAK
jgi:hypothetical protein